MIEDNFTQMNFDKYKEKVMKEYHKADDTFINKIYSHMINYVLDDIDEKYKDEVSKNYLEYLYKVYNNDTNFDEVIAVEKEMWEYENTNTKLMLLLVDDAYKEIKRLSKESYKLALRALEDNILISREEANEKINLLKMNLEKIREFNKLNAKKLVSEGILDYNFASGKQELSSLRLGHELRTRK